MDMAREVPRYRKLKPHQLRVESSVGGKAWHMMGVLMMSAQLGPTLQNVSLTTG